MLHALQKNGNMTDAEIIAIRSQPRIAIKPWQDSIQFARDILAPTIAKHEAELILREKEAASLRLQVHQLNIRTAMLNRMLKKALEK